MHSHVLGLIKFRHIEYLSNIEVGYFLLSVALILEIQSIKSSFRLFFTIQTLYKLYSLLKNVIIRLFWLKIDLSLIYNKKDISNKSVYTTKNWKNIKAHLCSILLAKITSINQLLIKCQIVDLSYSSEQKQSTIYRKCHLLSLFRFGSVNRPQSFMADLY